MANDNDSRVSKHINQLIEESLAIEAEEAKAAGAVGFMARALTQATMPHRRTETSEFSRRNGTFELSIMAPSRVGLPYGSIPRLLISWVTTEAIRTDERELVLGDSLADFMRELDLAPTGGRWGSITRLRNQMRRLFSAAVSATYSDDERIAGINFALIERYNLWWQPKQPEQAALWESTLTLSQPFFDEIKNSPIPVDIRALKALRRSPMALDIYTWLTYRMSYLRKRTMIPWKALQLQFGADYGRLRDFKARFIKQLKSVCAVYPDAKVQPLESGLELRPSRPHIAFKSR